MSALTVDVRLVLSRRLDQATATPRRAWATTFTVLLACYALTAHWYGVQSIDSIAAAWPGWQLARHGNVWLEHITDLPAVPWFSEVHGHLISNRTAGVILIAVPLQLLLMPLTSAGPLLVATLTAAVVTAVAVANLGLLATRLGATPRWSLSAALLLGLGTGLWGNASGELWPHGPDALWLSLAALAMSRDRLWLAGIALGGALLTRPHFALVVAALALSLLLRRRSFRPVLRLAVPTSGAALLLVLWNGLVFDAPGITGGYARHLDHADHFTWMETATHVTGSLVAPLRGVLIFSPFVIPLAVALWRQRRALPDWTVGLAFGAVAYQCAQWRLTTFEGGTGFYGYRYFLEPLVMLFPASVAAVLADPQGLSRTFRSLAGFALAVTTVGAFFYRPTVGFDGSNSWKTWGTASAALDRGPVSAVLAVTTFLAVWAAVAIRREHRRDDFGLPTAADRHAEVPLLVH